MKLKKCYLLEIDLYGLDKETAKDFEGIRRKNLSADKPNEYNTFINQDQGETTDCNFFYGVSNNSLNIQHNRVIKNDYCEPSNFKDISFYRTPKLTLPQNKVALLKDKYNIKIKRDKDKADYIITSDNYISSLFVTPWENYYDASYIKDYIFDNKNVFTDDGFSFIEEFFKVIEENNENEGLEDIGIALKVKSSYWIKQYLGSKYQTFLTSQNIHSFDNELKVKACMNIEESKELLFSNNIVKDSYVLSKCNEDSVVLSAEDCKNISKMIQSDDKDSAALALEMMANCNIEKSFDKVALIFAFYGHHLKYLSNWNSVNVKSLRKRMECIREVNFDYIYGFDCLIRELAKNNSLTTFASKVVMRKVFDRTLKRIGLTHEKSVFDFKVSDLKIKDEIPF